MDYIRPGSPADLSCKIFVGDEVVSMNGKSLHGMQVHFFFFILSFIFYFYLSNGLGLRGMQVPAKIVKTCSPCQNALSLETAYSKYA